MEVLSCSRGQFNAIRNPKTRGKYNKVWAKMRKMRKGQIAELKLVPKQGDADAEGARNYIYTCMKRLKIRGKFQILRQDNNPHVLFITRLS